jgi:hypothetical protein
LLSRIIDRHPNPESLRFFRINDLAILTDVLAKYELAQLAVYEFTGWHPIHE